MFGTLDEQGDIEGTIIDVYGESYMSCIELTSDRFIFTKRYVHREDTLQYRLSKQSDGTWQGVYEGRSAGTGNCRCIVTQVHEDFFHPTFSVSE